MLRKCILSVIRNITLKSPTTLNDLFRVAMGASSIDCRLGKDLRAARQLIPKGWVRRKDRKPRAKLDRRGEERRGSNEEVLDRRHPLVRYRAISTLEHLGERSTTIYIYIYI